MHPFRYQIHLNEGGGSLKHKYANGINYKELISLSLNVAKLQWKVVSVQRLDNS